MTSLEVAPGTPEARVARHDVIKPEEEMTDKARVYYHFNLYKHIDVSYLYIVFLLSFIFFQFTILFQTHFPCRFSGINDLSKV